MTNLNAVICTFTQASSGCKPNIRCHNTGNGQYFCGPYQISWYAIVLTIKHNSLLNPDNISGPTGLTPASPAQLASPMTLRTASSTRTAPRRPSEGTWQSEWNWKIEIVQTLTTNQTHHHHCHRWGADCDGNGQVDCFDYAAIHKVRVLHILLVAVCSTIWLTICGSDHDDKCPTDQVLECMLMSGLVEFYFYKE